MLRVQTVMTGRGGAPWYSAFHFKSSGGLEAANTAVAVGVYWEAIRAVMATGVTIDILGEVADINPATGDIVDIYPVTPIQKLSNGGLNALPIITQACVRLLTPTFAGGRRIQGRHFVPYPTENSNVDPGVPETTYRNTLSSAISNLRTGQPVGNELCIYSRTKLSATAVSSSIVLTKWSYLRSRRD
jgi:hypothetical protein